MNPTTSAARQTGSNLPKHLSNNILPPGLSLPPTQPPYPTALNPQNITYDRKDPLPLWQITTHLPSAKQPTCKNIILVDCHRNFGHASFCSPALMPIVSYDRNVPGNPTCHTPRCTLVDFGYTTTRAEGRKREGRSKTHGTSLGDPVESMPGSGIQLYSAL